MKVDVSIICNCYNHGMYISDAIEGFLAQEGDFTYEILINDDASTDNSQEIIRSYEREYPELIRTWLHVENQHQKKVPFVRNVVIPSAKGRYISYCEGDDYWVSPHKLRNQLEFMDAHEEYSASVHNCYVVDYEKDAVYLSEPIGPDKDKLLADIIVQGGGLLNPTASFLFRRSVMSGPYPHMPPVGDHFALIRAAIFGPIRWMGNPMSVYRRGVPGSDTLRTRVRNADEIRRYHERYIDALLEVQESLNPDLRIQTSDAFERRFQMQIRSYVNEYVRSKDASIIDVLHTDASLSAKGAAVMSDVLPKRIYTSLYRALARRDMKRDGRLVSFSAASLPQEVMPMQRCSDG